MENVTAEDSGRYEAVLGNDQGKVRAAIDLHISAKPVAKTEPGPPRNLQVITANASGISIAWEAPDHDGNSPITQYIIVAKEDDWSKFKKVAKTSPEVTEAKVTKGVEEGKMFLLRVYAVNEVGIGLESAETVEPITIKAVSASPPAPDSPTTEPITVQEVVPKTAPGPPSDLKVLKATPDGIEISWVAPTENGGADVTDYIVVARKEGDEKFKKVAKTSALTVCVTKNIQAGNAYMLRVYASNEHGIGSDACETESPVLVPAAKTVPGPVQNLKVAKVDSEGIIITWETPLVDGGATPLSYVIVAKETAAEKYKKVAKTDELSHRITKNIVSGNEYLVRVYAQNEVGMAEECAEIPEPISVPASITTPSLPQSVTVSDVTPSSIKVSWEAPNNDGGAPVTKYVVLYRKSSVDESEEEIVEVESSQTEVTLTEVTEGEQYEIKVFAVNSAGRSEDPAQPTASVKVPTKPKPPQAPTTLTLTEVTHESITVGWESSEETSSAISEYVIVAKESEGEKYKKVGKVDSTESSFKITKNITEEKSYDIRVYSSNEHGISEDYAELKSTVQVPKKKDDATSPGAPKDLEATAVTSDCVTVTWKAPDNNGGSPILNYIFVAKEADADKYKKVAKVDASETTAEITKNISEGQQYNIRVYAVNAIGISEEFSELQDAVKIPLLQQPSKVPSAPRSLKVKNVTSRSVTICWETPESDGGESLIEYIIVSKEVTSEEYKKVAKVEHTELAYDITKNISAGAEYNIRVYAVNIVGISEDFSELPDPVKVPEPAATIPAGPKDLKVKTVTSESVTVEWTAPSEDGGKPLLEYIVVAKNVNDEKYKKVGKVKVEDTLECVITKNITDGESYNIRVYAVSEVGVSEEFSEIAEAVAIPKKEPEVTVPSAPRSVNVTDVSPTSITISFESAESTGGSDIREYIVVMKEVNEEKFRKVAKVSNEETSCEITKNVTEGQFSIRVYAANEVGISEEYAEIAEAVKVQKAKAVPSAPKSLKVTGCTSESVTLLWDKPDSDGGVEVTDYIIVAKDVSAEKYRKVAKVTATETTCEVTKNIVAGEEYNMRVYAVNEVGTSEDYAELDEPIKIPCPAIVPTPPGPPTTVKVREVTSESIVIEWEAPENDGGAVLLEYIVVMKEAADEKYKKVGKVSKEESSFEITKNVASGLEYHIRVYATNEIGISEDFGEVSEVVKVPEKEVVKTVPTGPRSLKVASVTPKSIVVCWDEPESDGGSDVKEYIIVSKEIDAEKYKKVGKVDNTQLEFEITKNVSEDTEYNVRVYASNEIGISEEFAELEESIKVPKEVSETEPSAPRSLKVTAVDTESITITWEAPESDGGKPVTEYVIVTKEVSADKYKKVGKSTELSFEIRKNISEGNDYNVRVYSVNEIGISEEFAELSEPVKVTSKPQPLTVPSAPRSLKVTEVAATSITLTWEAPESDGGTPLEDYVIVAKEADSDQYHKAGKTSELEYCVTKGIEPNKEYVLQVYAANSEGLSEKAAEHESTILTPPPPKQPPGPPTNIRCLEALITGLTVAWEAPLFDGGCAVQQYIVVVKAASDAKYKKVGRVDGSARQYTITTLEPYSRCSVRVYAVNAAGIGEEAAELSDIPTVQEAEVLTEPPPPRNVVIGDITEQSLLVRWEPPEEDTRPVKEYIIVAKRVSEERFKKVGKVEANVLEFEITKNIEAGVEYDVRVYSANEAGISTEAAELAAPVRAISSATAAPPAAPVSIQLEDIQSTSVRVTWQPPAEVRAIKSFDVEKKTTDQEKFETVATVQQSEKTEFVVQDLKENTDYVFRVFSVNENGRSEHACESEPIRTVCAQKVPQAPSNLQVVEVKPNAIKVKWDAPADDGGSAITEYVIVAKDAESTKFKKAGRVDATDVEFEVVKNISADTEYMLRVYAANEIGLSEEGVETASPVRTPKNLPSAPSTLRVLQVDLSGIYLAWEPPTADCDVTEYVIVMKEADQDKFRKVGKSGECCFTITTVEENHEYHVRVYSANEAGVSEEGVETVTPILVKDKELSTEVILVEEIKDISEDVVEAKETVEISGEAQVESQLQHAAEQEDKTADDESVRDVTDAASLTQPKEELVNELEQAEKTVREERVQEQETQQGEEILAEVVGENEETLAAHSVSDAKASVETVALVEERVDVQEQSDAKSEEVDKTEERIESEKLEVFEIKEETLTAESKVTEERTQVQLEELTVEEADSGLVQVKQELSGEVIEELASLMDAAKAAAVEERIDQQQVLEQETEEGVSKLETLQEDKIATLDAAMDAALQLSEEVKVNTQVTEERTEEQTALLSEDVVSAVETVAEEQLKDLAAGEAEVKAAAESTEVNIHERPLVAPKIEDLTDTVEVIEGSAIRLSCRLSGKRAWHAVWRDQYRSSFLQLVLTLLFFTAFEAVWRLLCYCIQFVLFSFSF